MSWFIERILSSKKITDRIHTAPKFFVAMKGSFIVPTLYNIFTQNVKQMIKFDFPRHYKAEKHKQQSTWSYKIGHWFHKDFGSLFIVTCLSHSIFKLEWDFGFAILGALHSPSLQRMESDLVYPISLGNFSAVPCSSPFLQSGCCHASNLLIRSVQIWSPLNGEVRFGPGNFLWHHIPWNRICQFIWILSKGFTYTRVKRSYFKMAPQPGLKKTNL